jgi:ABC-2 type transport system permease protein
LVFSSLFVFFRDLGHIWEILLQVLFYGSAVVFPITFVNPAIRQALLLNPVAQIIEDARHALVTSAVPWTWQVTGLGRFFVPLGIVAIALTVGVVIFRSASPRFAESL